MLNKGRLQKEAFHFSKKQLDRSISRITLHSQLRTANLFILLSFKPKGNMCGIPLTWMKLQVFSSLLGKRPQNPQFRAKKCVFLAFLGHSPGGALRAIQSHISIAAVILAFYRVWKNEMGFCNHITVLNTSPQNESTTKQGKRVFFFFFFASLSHSRCPHLWVVTSCFSSSWICNLCSSIVQVWIFSPPRLFFLFAIGMCVFSWSIKICQ